MSDVERQDWFVYWNEFGRRMSIAGLFETISEFRAFARDYEARRFIYAPTNRLIAERTIDLVLSMYSVPRAMQPAARPVALAICAPALVAALGCRGIAQAIDIAWVRCGGLDENGCSADQGYFAGGRFVNNAAPPCFCVTRFARRTASGIATLALSRTSALLAGGSFRSTFFTSARSTTCRNWRGAGRLRCWTKRRIDRRPWRCFPKTDARGLCRTPPSFG